MGQAVIRLAPHAMTAPSKQTGTVEVQRKRIQVPGMSMSRIRKHLEQIWVFYP
jgi:hypothetical protein